MQLLFTLTLTVFLGSPAFASGATCTAYHHTFQLGERDCNRRVCLKGGRWSKGAGTKKMCRYPRNQKPCYAFGKHFAIGEEDCNGRVCLKSGEWSGVPGKAFCEYPDAELGVEEGSAE